MTSQTEMEVLTAGFAEFYSALYPGTQPYAWQMRLVSTIAEQGRWPDQISAPTGAGKTGVIPAHVYLNAVAGEALGGTDGPTALGRRLQQLPRRMVITAPRRALVDDQSDVSARIQEKLQGAEDGILRRVRTGLELRAGAARLGEHPLPPSLLVDTVRGALPRKQYLDGDAWQTHPTYAALIHMTPEMLGSAVLFRHYGAGRKRRPQDAGLLGLDTVAVIDEGHLQRQLLLTARRVGVLNALSTLPSERPTLQVVATTATPPGDDSGTTVVDVHASDLSTDAELEKRMQAAKTLETMEPEGAGRSNERAQEIVDLLLQLKKEAENQPRHAPVGFVANTVASALQVSKALEKVLERQGLDPSRVFTVVGRMRPIDRQLDLAQHPGVLTPQGCPDVDFIISTQVLEVGVDLDLFGLVTELPSGSALAQRAGRVNRVGDYSGSRVVVVLPRKPTEGVYTVDEQNQARDWIRELDGNISPWQVHDHPAPAPALPRRALQRLELWDAHYFAATSERLVGEDRGSGVELWTRDSFDSVADVSVVVRGLPPDDALAARVLELMPPQRLEMLPASFVTTQEVLLDYLNDPATKGATRRFFRWNPMEGRAEVFRADSGNGLAATDLGLAPGAVVIVDNTAELFEGKSLTGKRENPLADQRQEAELVRAEQVEDAKLSRASIAVRPTKGQDATVDWMSPYSRLSDAQAAGVFAALDAIGEDDALPDASESGEDELQRSIALALDRHGASEGRPRVSIDVVAEPGPDPQVAVIVERVPAWDEEEVVYEATSPAPVALADHSAAVSQRAERIAQILDLSPELTKAVRAAGQLHDAGKADLRFQAVLRLRKTLPTGLRELAKSSRRSRRLEKEIRSAYDLTGWRHEQVSAAVADSMLPLDAPHRDLTLRLVGTSHGYGRSDFPSDASALLTADSGFTDSVWRAGDRLFGEGIWEYLIDETHRRYGIWTSAFLEALLRAADGTISGEGK